MKTSQEIYQETVAALSITERRAIYPPKVMKNFVVRKSWYGRGQIITFTPKPTTTVPDPKPITYNHDIVLDMMRAKLELQMTWEKRGYWSQSTNIPLELRHRELVASDDPYLNPPKKAKAKK